MASDPSDWHPWLVDAALAWLRGVVRDCLACSFPSSSVGREGQDPESTYDFVVTNAAAPSAPATAMREAGAAANASVKLKDRKYSQKFSGGFVPD